MQFFNLSRCRMDGAPNAAESAQRCPCLTPPAVPESFGPKSADTVPAKQNTTHRYQDRNQDPVVFGHSLTSKRLFIDTSWKVLVVKGLPSCLRHVPFLASVYIFLGTQHWRRNTSEGQLLLETPAIIVSAQLIPLLDHVMKGSLRLTEFFFCFSKHVL